jgi:hypothetical protein
LEERLCRGGTKRDKVIEHFVKLYQEFIEKVQVCTSGLCLKFKERGVKERHHRVTEYYVSFANVH